MIAGSFFGQYSQPNGGLLGLAAGMMAGVATAAVLGSYSLGLTQSLAWAGAGALLTWLLWQYQVTTWQLLQCCPVSDNAQGHVSSSA